MRLNLLEVQCQMDLRMTPIMKMMTMSMEHWWNDDCQKKTKYLEKHLSH
jgi:hypothetical protein